MLADHQSCCCQFYRKGPHMLDLGNRVPPPAGADDGQRRARAHPVLGRQYGRERCAAATLELGARSRGTACHRPSPLPRRNDCVVLRRQAPCRHTTIDARDAGRSSRCAIARPSGQRRALVVVARSSGFSCRRQRCTAPWRVAGRWRRVRYRNVARAAAAVPETARIRRGGAKCLYFV